jgi:hypothetical protein
MIEIFWKVLQFYLNLKNQLDKRQILIKPLFNNPRQTIVKASQKSRNSKEQLKIRHFLRRTKIKPRFDP